MHKTPTFTAPVFFRDPAAALAQVQRIYQHNIEFLRRAMRDFVAAPMSDYLSPPEIVDKPHRSDTP